jgi:lantibiotic modifying enzyme
MGDLTEEEVAALRSAANAAADLIIETAITAGGRSTWLAPTVEWADGTAVVAHRTGDPSMYEGSAGIALACSSVAQSLQRNDLAELAITAARHAVSGADRLAGPGLLDGLAGVGHAALEIGAKLGDEELKNDGRSLLGRVDTTPTTDFDVVSGSAGEALAFVSAARRTSDDRWVRAALRASGALLATAQRDPWGWRWADTEARGLCGLAHGAAGAAWAFGEVHALTEDERLLDGVEGARRFERSWYQPARSNWPDLRRQATTPDGEPTYPAWWCHGAAGIGLSRLALHQIQGHPWLAGEAAVALQASTDAAWNTLQVQEQEGLTLCHGLGSTLLLLIAAHDVLGEPEHLATARLIATQALHRLPAEPGAWPSGVRDASYGPGLMTGLAGVMHVLARTADPEGVPAIVALGVPPAHPDLAQSLRGPRQPTPLSQLTAATGRPPA